MSAIRGVFAFLVCVALLGAAPRAATGAEDAKKTLQQADKALTSGVRELGKGFKKASQAVDRAAKTGSEAVRRAAKGQGQ